MRQMTDHSTQENKSGDIETRADVCSSCGVSAAEPMREDREALRSALDGLQGKYLRVQADLVNIRRRAEDEWRSGRRAGQREVLQTVLPALDAFDRCLTTHSTDVAFQEGVAAIHALLIRSLRQVGAERIDSVGRRFDPRVHDAVVTQPVRDPDEVGRIVAEIRAGWRVADHVVRPASVVVTVEMDRDGEHSEQADVERHHPTRLPACERVMDNAEVVVATRSDSAENARIQP